MKITKDTLQGDDLINAERLYSTALIVDIITIVLVDDNFGTHVLLPMKSSPPNFIQPQTPRPHMTTSSFGREYP